MRWRWLYAYRQQLSISSPHMNGKELAGRVQAMRPGIRTLFTSGYTADTIAHRGVLDAGIWFLEKPFSMDSLARKVREVLAA